VSGSLHLHEVEAMTRSRQLLTLVILLIGCGVVLASARVAGRNRQSPPKNLVPSHDSAAAVQRAIRYMRELHRPIPNLRLDTTRVRVGQAPDSIPYKIVLMHSFPDQRGFLIQLSPDLNGLGGDGLLW